jgi:hypothetical protein
LVGVYFLTVIQDNIFPGHGGFTDRTDCQYITGLFVYVYYQMFIKSSSFVGNYLVYTIVAVDCLLIINTDLQSVLDQALALSLEEQISLMHKLNETIAHALHNAAL